MLRRAGLGVIVCASLLAPTAGKAGPALVFEPYNGTVFYAEDPDTPWFPASLTKLMTAYVVFEAIKEGRVQLNSPLVCSKRAAAQAPSKLGLPVGGQITVEQGLKVLIVKSANDVAVMLAEKVSGSEAAFIAEMNAAAKRLGMTRTRFVNPNGLPGDGQMTTARDLAKLTRAIIVDYPEYAEMFAMPSVQIGNKVMRSHNGLLRTFAGADGMKTGFICDSGFNVVASATRDGRRLVAVVLGEPSVATRSDRAANLLENGFKRYFWKSVFGTTVDGLAVQASLSAEPAHLREDVCGAGRAKRLQEQRQRRAARSKQRSASQQRSPASSSRLSAN